MKVKFLKCVFYALHLFLISAIAQEKEVYLSELQINSWDLDHQIKLKSTRPPQFADVVRNRDSILPKEMSRDEIRQKNILFGEKRIREGKASTNFRYSYSLSLREYLWLYADSLELKEIIDQHTEVCLSQFRQRLKAEKLSLNDIADASALAFALSYEIYFGEKISKPQIDWMRSKGREILLNSASFQGISDLERQRAFETFGVLTMYAKMLQDKGLKGDLTALTEAKETVAEVLKQIWGNSPDTIQQLPNGFIHKGQKIILDNRATQFFTYNQDLNIVQKLAFENRELTNKYASWLESFHQDLLRQQMSSNDLAACGTVSFSTVYEVLLNGNALTKQQTSSVYELLKKAVLTSADIQAATNENKQIACETFAIRAMSIKNQAPADSKQVAENFVKTLFKSFGEDFNNYQLTNESLVKTAVIEQQR